MYIKKSFVASHKSFTCCATFATKRCLIFCYWYTCLQAGCHYSDLVLTFKLLERANLEKADLDLGTSMLSLRVRHRDMTDTGAGIQYRYR